MFIDEIYEQVLIEKGGKPTTAHIEACKQKFLTENGKKIEMDDHDYVITVKQIENGYQGFRRKHPEFPEHGFRRYVWVQKVVHGHEDEARVLFLACGWKELTPEQIGLTELAKIACT
jgi:hypothetical protein